MEQIDYKEKYEHALERARQFSEKPYLEDSAGIVEYIFPELKEKRIRKALINGFKDYKGWDEEWFDGITVREAIAWLEKQGEPKPTDKIQLGKKYKCIASPRYSTFMIGKMYKPEDKFLCSLMNFCSDCFEPIEDGEQKPADEIGNYGHGKVLDALMSEIKTPEESLGIDSDTYSEIVDKCTYGDDKQEWSEEDEVILSDIICSVNASDAFCGTILLSLEKHEKKISWLKSIKDRVQPQSRWKPSVGQMDILQKLCEHNSVVTLTKEGIEAIESLYQDLKKLREE